MTMLLISSVLLNITLFALAAYYYQHRMGRPLPKSKPDFAGLEQDLEATIDSMGLTDVVELDKVVRRPWVCQARLRFLTANGKKHKDSYKRLMNKVAAARKLPCREAGYRLDECRMGSIVGINLEFGYCMETGYNIVNQLMLPGAPEAKPAPAVKVAAPEA